MDAGPLAAYLWLVADGTLKRRTVPCSGSATLHVLLSGFVMLLPQLWVSLAFFVLVCLSRNPALAACNDFSGGASASDAELRCYQG